MYEQPKKLSKGYSFSQCTKAPKLKGMAGFPNYGRVGGKVVPGKDQP
jgi:hypothetical protein